MSKLNPPAAPKTPTANKVSVVLRKEDRPGLQRCGEYEAGRPYTVAIDEAERLVAHKGFSFHLPGDKAAFEEAITERNRERAAAAAAAKVEG
jgi:hypothetical protein